MSLETTTRTIDAYLDSLQERGDFGRFFAEDALWTTMENGQEIRGRDAVRDFIAALHTQLFDARLEVRSVIVGDGSAALEAEFVGVHTGEFAGVPATGADVRAPYSVFYDVTDRGITALRAYMPLRQMIADLQAAQPVAS